MPPAVEFVNRPYLWSLVGLTTALLLYNLSALLFGPSLFALFPIVVQSTVLVLLLARHRFVVLFVRVWSAVLVLSAVAFAASIFFTFLAAVISPSPRPMLPANFTWARLTLHICTLSAGLWFFLYAKTAMRVTPAEAHTKGSATPQPVVDTNKNAKSVTDH